MYWGPGCSMARNLEVHMGLLHYCTLDCSSEWCTECQGRHSSQKRRSAESIIKNDNVISQRITKSLQMSEDTNNPHRWKEISPSSQDFTVIYSTLNRCWRGSLVHDKKHMLIFFDVITICVSAVHITLLLVSLFCILTCLIFILYEVTEQNICFV